LPEVVKTDIVVNEAGGESYWILIFVIGALGGMIRWQGDHFLPGFAD
jgi:hypothetical protein